MKTELTKITPWLFAGLLAIISSILIFRNFNNDAEMQINHNTVLPGIASHLAMLKGNFMLQLSSDGHKINNVEIDNDEKMNIQDIVKNKPRIIFRFSSHQCISCLEEALKVLETLNGEYNFDNLMFLAKYKNIRALNLFIKDNNIKVDIYNAPDDLGIPAEDFDVPYFFILMPDLTTFSTFIPAKEIEQYTYLSLRTIIRNLNTLLSKDGIMVQ